MLSLGYCSGHCARSRGLQVLGDRRYGGEYRLDTRRAHHSVRCLPGARAATAGLTYPAARPLARRRGIGASKAQDFLRRLHF
jgi:hypothetical protein